MTHAVLSMSMPRLEVLCGSAVAEKLVRAYGVVGFLPLPWFTIGRRHIQRAVRQLVRLFGVGQLGALDGAMQLRDRDGLLLFRFRTMNIIAILIPCSVVATS